MNRLFLSTLVSSAIASSALAGDPAVGIWQAEPDRKGQVGYIRIAPCGPDLCATIIRAFDSTGREIMTPNVGRRLFWNMKALGNGRYGKGRVYVPAHRREYDAKMTLVGRDLAVRGCVGKVCRGQIWTRVR